MALAPISAGALIKGAVRDICVISTAGMSADTSTDVYNDCLIRLNQMVDQWQTRRLMSAFNRQDTYNLVGQQFEYTIGPSGADFTADVPTIIDRADLLLNNVSPVVRLTVSNMTRGEWMRTPIPNLTPGAIPSALYFERGNDAQGAVSTKGQIRLWPPPIEAYQLLLMTPQQLQQFADLTTTYFLPFGLQAALRSNLAVRIRPMMTDYIKTMKSTGGSMKDSQFGLVQSEARETLLDLERFNSKPETVSAAPEYMQDSDGGWNYMSDQFTGSSR
jgi:hypothetical protein